MPTLIHQLENLLELLEVLAFCRSEWISIEEWNDHISEIIPPRQLIAHQVLAVIVMSSVAIDLPAFEEALNEFENFNATFALNNRKLRLNLPAAPHPSILLNRTAEASFTVDQADDPSLEH